MSRNKTGKKVRHQILLPPGWFAQLQIMFPAKGGSGTIEALVGRLLRDAGRLDEHGRIKDSDTE